MPEQTFETLKSSAGKKAAEAAQAQASFGAGPSTQPSFASQQASDPALDRILQEQADAGSESAAQELRERQIADAQQSFQNTQQAYQDAIASGVFGTSAANKFLISPTMAMGQEIIEGLTGKGKKDILEALGQGKSFANLTEDEKINLAYLIAANKKNENVLGGTFCFDEKEFDEYQKKYGIDLETLKSRADDYIEDFEKETSGFESLIKQYEAGEPQGFKQSVSALVGLYDRPEGTLSRKELQDELGKEGIAYLKANNPKLYYRFNDPQTSQGIEELASQSLQGLSNSPEDRRYAARIVEARALADRDRTTDATGQVVSGKPILPVTPLPGPRPGPVPDPIPGPILTPTPTPFPGTGIISAVTDPRFVGPMFPGVPTAQNYFNQGIANPNFQRFFQIANQFPTTT